MVAFMCLSCYSNVCMYIRMYTRVHMCMCVFVGCVWQLPDGYQPPEQLAQSSDAER